MSKFAKTPLALPGMRIGLLGGSFDPPHGGHLHISLQAMKQLKLDFVWWLVSPANPLKKTPPWPLEKRLDQAHAMARHPRIIITDLEARLSSYYSFNTIQTLQTRHPATRFVWIMGADNLHQFHYWRRWQQIFKTIPVAIFDRPGYRHTANASQTAAFFRNYRQPATQGPCLSRANPPAWSLLTLPLTQLSSTRIRQQHIV